MSQINPNDPVVAILQQAVQGLRTEVLEQHSEMEEAMRMFAEGIGQMLGGLSSRVAVLERQVVNLRMAGGDFGSSGDPDEGTPSPEPTHEGGKEL